MMRYQRKWKVQQDLRKIGFHAKIEGIFPTKAQ